MLFHSCHTAAVSPAIKFSNKNMGLAICGGNRNAGIIESRLLKC
jgi:hypothetical protein